MMDRTNRLPSRFRRGERSLAIAGLTARVLLLVAGLALGASAAPSFRIAVAPFAGEEPDLPVAKALTGRLAERELERLIPPGAFVADARMEPHAEVIRRWAYNAAVEAVVVGRVEAVDPEQGDLSRRVDVVVRSGHSGAELARHGVVLQAPSRLEEAAETLASAILVGLGYREPEPRADVAPPPVAGGRAQAGAPDGDPAAGRGLDADFGLEGFNGDAPIEIKADEAEIISRGEERELIFQRNVFVRQANVTLRSDRLEASYRKGESDPRKLVARGRVHIDQGGRTARCDQATYVREAQRLTCRGHAELIQGCDIVRGESIEFDFGRDKARVEGAASIVIQPDESEEAVCPAEEGFL